MTTTEATTYAIEEAERLWLGQTPEAWGDVVRIVPEEARAEVAEQIEVLVAVDVDEPRAVRRRDTERERPGVEHRPCGAAGQHA